VSIPAREALTRLWEGNRRFVSGSQEHVTLANGATHGRRLRSEAAPIAIILGCSDSRVPVETVFDQSVGDLFVVRVAGNIVGPSQIGSIEFAVEQFATSLIVVLGHSMCGAVMAAIEDLGGLAESRALNSQKIVDAIRSSLEESSDTGGLDDSAHLLEKFVRANIRASLDRLLEGSHLLDQLAQRGELLIVGAEYSLNTGIVEFLDIQPNDSRES